MWCYEQVRVEMGRYARMQTSPRSFGRLAFFSVFCLFLYSVQAQDIASYDRSGWLTWTNGLSNAVYEVEWSSSLDAPAWTNSWSMLTGIQPTTALTTVSIPMFYRVKATPYPEITNRDECYLRYSNALLDAKNALPAEIFKGLTPISTNTPGLDWRLFTNWVDGTTSLWVRVAALKFASGWTWDTLLAVGPQTMSNQWSTELWVTPYPELKNLCAAYTGTNQTLRMQKALGLPPRTGGYGVAEVFVDPKYMFRPAPDPEINDEACGLAPDSAAPFLQANPWHGISANYAAWFAATYNSRGYDATNNLDYCWPWTRLGYTYDYENAPGSPMGLSEYVIIDPTQTNFWGSDVSIPIYIDAKYAAEDY